MAIEVERKFLVRGDAWRDLVVDSSLLVQGYLRADDRASVRVRVAGQQGWLTIKGPSSGAARVEFEYGIPADQAEEIVQLFAIGVVKKTRFRLSSAPGEWTVDVFDDDNAGLILLEIEDDTAAEITQLPRWVGVEVTNNPGYYNSELSKHPYREWRGHGNGQPY